MAGVGRSKLRENRKPISHDPPQPALSDLIFVPFLLIVFFLIKIGDIIKLLFRLITQAFSTLSSIIVKIKIKASCYPLPLIKLPKLKKPKISLPQIVIPRLLELPKLSFAFPVIKISLPKITIKAGWAWFSLGIVFTLIFILIPYQVLIWLSSLPHPRLLSAREIPVTTKVFDRKGLLLYEIYAEQDRTPIALSEIPEFLKEATLAIEDKEFYSHPGFSLRGILRAAKETFIYHRLQGGSTITQQLVRSALLTPEPTLSRKVKEIVLSFWAERIYSKNQILEMYFNQVPYGGTAWGVQSAAKIYFGKNVADLSLAESVFLAGLPSAPTIYSPFGTHPELGISRQKEVLSKMIDQGFITKEQEFEAKEYKLEFLPPKTEIAAPHFVMYVRDLLEKKYGSRLTNMGGLRVITSLDLSLQKMSQEIVTSEVEKLIPLHVGNGSSLITNPATGEILAMVGSINYFDLGASGNVNVTLALRQPGSSIKVVNYALALQKGFTAASFLDDSPISFEVAGQPPYSPVNYDGRFHGRIPLRYALANSYNIPAVRVLAKLGVTNMIDQGKTMGITSWKDESRYGLSLTLGGGEVTMLDMARVYGTLANFGKEQELTAILKVSDYKGQILEEFKPKRGLQAIPPGVAFILSDILADNQARSATFGPYSLLVIPGKTVSVKTGTSNDLRDNWAIGFTPSYVVAVWVGNNDNSPMSRIASGVTGATPIWHQIMENLLKEKLDEPFAQPEDIVKIEVCGRSEYFLKGTEKAFVCPPSPSSSPN